MQRSLPPPTAQRRASMSSRLVHFGRVAPPVARAGRTVVPGSCVHGLNLLLCEGLGDQAGLPDALHKVTAPTAVHFQDNRIIGILAFSDHLDYPVRKVERVVTLRGLQAVDQSCPSGSH